MPWVGGRPKWQQGLVGVWLFVWLWVKRVKKMVMVFRKPLCTANLNVPGERGKGVTSPIKTVSQ